MSALELPAGIIDLYHGQAIQLLPGQRLVGAGIDQTILRWHGSYDFLTPGSGNCVVPADDVIVEDLTIECAEPTYWAGCIGSRQPDGDPPFRNAIFRRLKVIGFSDVFYVRHDLPCSAYLEEVEALTRWDLLMLAATTPDDERPHPQRHQFLINRCNLIADGRGWKAGNGLPQDANCTTVLNGEVSITNSFLKAIPTDETYPNVTTTGRALFTHNDRTGFVPGSFIMASNCYLSAPVLSASCPATQIHQARSSTSAGGYTHIERNKDGIRLKWWTEIGALYAIQATTDFKTWLYITDSVAGVDGLMGLDIPVNPTDQPHYYRIVTL